MVQRRIKHINSLQHLSMSMKNEKHPSNCIFLTIMPVVLRTKWNKHASHLLAISLWLARISFLESHLVLSAKVFRKNVLIELPDQEIYHNEISATYTKISKESLVIPLCKILKFSKQVNTESTILQQVINPMLHYVKIMLQDTTK